MKTLWTLLLFILTTVTTYAGDKGNIIDIPDDRYGGDAVVCRNDKGQITSARLLDYVEKDPMVQVMKVQYEKRYSDLRYIDLLSTQLMQIAPDVFHTFRREGLRLAKYMQPYAMKDPQFVFIDSFVMARIPDLGNKIYPIIVDSLNCRVEQLVIRHKVYNGLVYYIQNEIFKKLSPMDRRGIILHEALYHTFNQYYGDQDSGRTRYFNRNLMVPV